MTIVINPNGTTKTVSILEAISILDTRKPYTIYTDLDDATRQQRLRRYRATYYAKKSEDPDWREKRRLIKNASKRKRYHERKLSDPGFMDRRREYDKNLKLKQKQDGVTE